MGGQAASIHTYNLVKSVTTSALSWINLINVCASKDLIVKESQGKRQVTSEIFNVRWHTIWVPTKEIPDKKKTIQYKKAQDTNMQITGLQPNGG